MAEEFTAKFRVDISDLKKNITEASKQIKLANATFKSSTAGMDDWAKDADGLAAKLKQLDTVLSSQKSILSSYQQQLERQQKGYEQNGQRADELKAKLQQLASQGVDKASDEYKEYERELVKTLKEQDNNGKAVDDLKLKILNQQAAIGKTEKELRNYQGALDHVGDELEDVSRAEQEANSMSGQLGDGFTVLKGIAANLASQALRSVVNELKSLATEGAAYADDILTLSKTTSLSTDTLQKFAYMADLVDVDLGTVAGSLKKLTKNMASAEKGSGAAYDTFEQLGVSFQNADGTLRDNEETFYDIIEALGKMENETERDALAMNLFGKNATELNPMIDAGADALEAWGKEAEEVGAVMDEDMLDSLGALQDSYDRFNQRVKAVKNQIAAGFAPALERATKKADAMLASGDWKKWGDTAGKAMSKVIDFLEWVIKNGGTVKTILAGIIAALAVSKINAATTAVKGFVTTLKSMWAVIVANPVTAFVGAIVAAGAALLIWQKSLFDAEKAADVSWQKTNELTTALDEAGVAAQQAADNYASLSETMNAGAEAGQIQGDHLRDLKNELDGLTDANGKVADSDKARAQVILNELNGALGTEYSMTGNVIDKYDELTGSIDSLIQKKQAMLVLEAEEEAYKQAIIGKAEAEASLIAMEEARIPIEDELAAKEQRRDEILAGSSAYIYEHAQELGQLGEQIGVLNSKLEENQDEYEATAAAVDGYSWDIQQYTKNAAAAIEEDYDKISHKSYETAKAAGDATNEASQTIITNTRNGSRAWLTSLGQMITEATGKKTEFRDAGDGMVQAYVDGVKEGEALPAKQVEGMNKQMMNRMTALAQQMGVSGGNAVEGFVNSVAAKEFLASNAGRNLANSFITAFRARMDEGSPSKEMGKSGLNAVLGLVNEVYREEGLAAKAGMSLAGAFLGGFQGGMYGLQGIAGTISGASVKGGVLGALGGISGASGGTTGKIVNQSYTQNIYTPKSPSRYEIYQETKNLLSLASGRA